MHPLQVMTSWVGPRNVAPVGKHASTLSFVSASKARFLESRHEDVVGILLTKHT
jgi:hypothetical protein